MDTKKLFKDKLVDQLKSAYRKFKTHTYYDNYGAINRAKIADFEKNCLFDDKHKFKVSGDDSEDFFDKLASKLINDDERSILFQDLLKKIDVLCYSKSIKSTNTGLGNIPDDSNEIDKLNYFIDLEVESHILGVLWILRDGWALDHRLHKNCHGNRINKEILSKIESCEKDVSKYSELKTPFLFEPYFKRYQIWRDEGLDSVEKLLDKQENAIMLSLDFKEYYYTSTINFKKLNNDIKNAKLKLFENSHDYSNKIKNTPFKILEIEKKLDKDLICFIESIFEKYTQRFFRRNYDHKYDPLILSEAMAHTSQFVPLVFDKLPMIPLGFLPSLIISNWNLQAFDQSVLDFLNPVYYGRYVDDILIVFKSHPESKSFSKENFDTSAKQIIEKYFIDNKNCKNNILRIINENNNADDIDYGVNNLKEKEFRYRENVRYNNFVSNYENLRIQPDKLKIFRFNHKNSRALIENFKEEIYRNSSEFRLMHPVKKLYADIGKNIFSIQYGDSINKIGDINSIKLNKFELSKILSWLIRSSIYQSGNVSSENIRNIQHAFSGSKKIDFMILWEKLIEFLFIEKEYDLLEEEIEKILIKISQLSFNGNDLSTYEFGKNNKDSEDLLKDSLVKFLYFSFNRVISLRTKNTDHINRVNKLFKKYLKINYIDADLSNKFVLSYLYKNSLMRDPLLLINKNLLENFIKSNNSEYDLIRHNFEILKDDIKEDYYPYYPRYIQFHETTLHVLNRSLFASSGDLDISNYIPESERLYNSSNYGFTENDSQINLFYKLECNATSCNCKLEKPKKEASKVNGDIADIISAGREKKTIIKIGLINTILERNTFTNALKGNPNRSSVRLDKIATIVNEAIKKDVELLVMPEMYIPYEWIPGILDISREHGMAMVFGIEPIICGKSVGNYIGIALPSETDNESKHKNCTFIMRLKKSYSPEELREYRRYGLDYKDNKSANYALCIWNDIYFAPYYCYEIANISDRAKFKSCCDMVIVSEYNRDTNYFTAIAESLSRDLFCYCVKVNSSEFGGTCILQPSKTESRYLVNLKGGDKDYVVTHTLKIDKLRNQQILDYESENVGSELKPKPPGFDDHIVRARMRLPNRKKEC